MSRMLKSKIFITLAVLLLLGALGVGVAVQQKYHVKKFIKGYPALYDLAMKVAVVKKEISGALFGKKEDGTKLRQIDVTKAHWNLVFDAGQSLGRYKRFWGDIGFESWKTGLLGGKSRQLFDYIAASNRRVGAGSFDRRAFRYIRAHNLYSNGQPPWGEGCDIYQTDSDGQVFYDWKTTNQIFDSILRMGFKPIIEFGFTPDALASIPDRRQKWGRGNISPPRDYRRWQNLVHQTVRHFVHRYGEDEVRSWYFEVWNEPDLGWLFWIESADTRRKPYGDLKEYHKLYDLTVKAAKAAFPGIRIGGPASAGGDIDRLLEHVFVDSDQRTNGHLSRIDFVSSHAYNKVGFDHRVGRKQALLSKIFWKLDSSVNHDHPVIREKIKTLPFLLTETGPKPKKNVIHKGRYNAAWYAKMVAGMFHLGDTLGWPFRPVEVVYWSAHQVVKYFDMKNGGIATTLKVDGNSIVLKLPVYNTIEALGYLSDDRIQLVSGSEFGETVHAIATKNGDQSVEVLLYHLNEDVDETATNGAVLDSVSVNVTIHNLPFEQFELREYIIDETHSNTYALWRKLGQPKKITRGELSMFKRSQGLALAAVTSEVALPGRNDLNLKFRMQTNSVRLFVLTRN